MNVSKTQEQLHTASSKNDGWFCSVICFKTISSKVRKVEMPNSVRKTSPYWMPTAWCASITAPQLVEETGVRMLAAHLLESDQQGRVLGGSCTHCWDNHKQKLLPKGLCQGFNFCQEHLLLWPTKTWHSDMPARFESHVSSQWNKVVGLVGKSEGVFCSITSFPCRQTAHSIFCIEFKKKSPSDLSPGLKGREEKIYIYKKVNAQMHRFICW